MQRIGIQLLSFMKRRNKVILVFLVSSVVFSGTLYSLSLGNNLRYRDEHDYYELATNIITSHRYSPDGEHPTAHRPPGYPLILSLFILLGANIAHLRILNFVALGLCMHLLHKILKEQSSRLAAILAVLLIVCYPVLFYTAGTLYPQTMGSFLFLLIIFLLMRNTKSYRTFALSGLLFGYLILTIPTFVFVLFVFGVLSYFFERSIGAKGTLITIALAFLPIGAWSARNYAVFNTFVFVSSNSGINLLLGNSENTTPNAGTNVDISKYSADAARLDLDEVERDRYYRSKAIEFIVSHKMLTVKLYCQKFLNYFHYRNKLATKAETSSAKDLIMLVTYGPLLLLFIFRIFFMKLLRPSPLEVLLIVLYISSAFLYAIFFTRIRFRLPFDFLLISVVAMFLKDILSVWLVKINTSSCTS